jgi:ABC-type dipeptide/oligopeptide/nickel transport system permease subunit
MAACASAPWLAPASPVQPVASPLARPRDHPPMGTDNLGRDEWSRMLYGGRVSLVASLSAAGLAVILGTTAALLAQGMGGAADATVVGGANAALAIPGLLISLAVVAVLGPGIEAVILAVGLGLTPGFTRLARQALAQVRSEAYIAAAGALGADGMDTARRHMLPNALPRLLSLATTHYAWAFAGITTLTFLGLSGSASRPEWGAMLNAARPYLRQAPWLAFFPGGAIVATILSVHTLGSWLAQRVRAGGGG